MGGFTIETAIMIVAGYGLCRVSTTHYRDLIRTIHDIEAQKEKEKQLIEISMTDELTGLYNRRCYDADVTAYGEKELEEDLVVFSMDVNGLKEANDTNGHAAGDELLMATAECLKTAITPVGKVYRTGGDEFLTLAQTAAPEAVVEQIKQRSASWHGAYVEQMSLSVG